MTYRVTQMDIELGDSFEPARCPVARAIKRRHAVKSVLVHSHDASIGTRYVRLPERVKAWIKAFDEGEEVRPFQFDIT